MELDYIIVGQGIAGSILSHLLLKRNKRVIVINNPKVHSASRVAAGIFNPVTGRKMVKSWNADTLFPFLHQYYPELEKESGNRFFYSKKIYRPFLSIEEQNEWMGKSASPQFAKYISKATDQCIHKKNIHDPYGGLELSKSGYVDLSVLLQLCQQTLINKNAYLEGNFDENALTIGQQKVFYKGLSATKLLFCDGQSGSFNRFFKWLPFSPVKGEILTIETEKENKIDTIFNRGVFILPLSPTICKVGATYEWLDLSVQPTPKGRNMLVKKLNDLYKGRYKIINHKAGIRPATRDRKPFIGLHPKYEPLGIFNGLGTKGVSLAPYYANQFVNFLEIGMELETEVNINRYFSLYYNH